MYFGPFCVMSPLRFCLEARCSKCERRRSAVASPFIQTILRKTGRCPPGSHKTASRPTQWPIKWLTWLCRPPQTFFGLCHCCLFPYVTCSIWCEAVTFTHQSVLCRAWRMFTQGGWRQNLARQAHQGCQFICGTRVVKRKKIISDSFRFKGFFFYDIILTKISVRLLPCRWRSFDWFVPGHFGSSADLFAVICEIQQGLLREYLIKLAFGCDPGVITHRTVCIAAHKRAQKKTCH